MGVETRSLIERLKEAATTYALGAEWVSQLLLEAATELEQASITRHRCVGCGHQWDGVLKGAELCGDCWRTARPVLHGPETKDPLVDDYRQPVKKTGPQPRLVKKRE